MSHAPTLLEIGIPNPNSKEVVWLSFELLNTGFERKWLAVLLQELECRKLWACRFGALCVDELNSRLRIKDAFQSLHRSFPEERSPLAKLGFEPVPYIPRNKLEALLKICNEIRGDEKSHRAQKSRAENLAKLLRHYLQIYFPEYHFHASLRTFAASVFELPRDADQNFTVDRHDGWLYLDYVGQGLDSMAAYDERNTHDLDSQIRFSNCFQMLYRDDFDGSELEAKAREWLSSTYGPALAGKRLNVGYVPIARPVHNLHRHVVRELFTLTDLCVQIRVSEGGKTLTANDFLAELESLRPWHPWGRWGLAITKFLRITKLAIPVGIYLDGYHRFESPLWFILQPMQPLVFYIRYQISTDFYDYRMWSKAYSTRLRTQFWRAWLFLTRPFHWARPHVFNLVFKASWPIRKMIYFVSFQFQKRILKRGDKP